MTLKFVFTVVLLLAASGCSSAGTTTVNKPLDGTYYGRSLPFAVF